jgi:hypothetical protein
VRLRAVDLLLNLKDKGRDAGSTRQPPVDVKRLTDDERARLAEILAAMQAFYQEVWTRDPEQRPDWAPHSPSIVEAVSAAATTEVARPTVSVTQTPEPADVKQPKPYQLPRELWNEAGLVESQGVVTHALGDEHAQKILVGEVSFEDARSTHEAARRQAEQIVACYE